MSTPGDRGEADAGVPDWARDFDHRHPAWVADPAPIWADLRARCPVAHTQRYGGVYLPTLYADVCAVAGDPERFSSRSVVVREFRGPAELTNPPINSDPPEHSAERRLLLRVFGPEAVARLEPLTLAVCRGLIADLRGAETIAGTVDVVGAYAARVPGPALAALIGLPAADGDLYRRWVSAMLDEGLVDPLASAQAHDELTAYVRAHVTDRQKKPGDDLVSELLAARIDGAPIGADRVVGMLRLLVIAGVDTTAAALGASLLHLSEQAADRAALVAEPAAIKRAVEEFLRAFAPVTMAREIVHDADIGGTPVTAGEMVLLSFAAANRDPAIFERPDEVILDRARERGGPRHLAFGHGRHRCLGAGLARMQLRVALGEWLAAFPDFSRDRSTPVTWSTGIVRGPRAVAVRLQPPKP